MDLARWMEPETGSAPIIEYWVNGNVPREGIERALREIADAGFGGAALRPTERPAGLNLSDLDTADRPAFALHAVVERWDEAARIVLRENPSSASQSLQIERCLNPKDAAKQAARPDVLGVYCLSLAEGQAVNGLEVFSTENPPPDDASDLPVAVSVVREANDPTGCSVDLLDRDTSRRLIETAFEPFLPLASPESRAGARRIAFVNLPEPPGADVGSFPWNPAVAERYREKWNEDPIPLLPLLWFDGPGAESFRWRMRSLVADLFLDGFVKPLSEWLHERNWLLAGGFDRNGSLTAQIVQGWGPFARFFETMDLPTVFDRTENPTVSTLSLRQALSAATQTQGPGVACRLGLQTGGVDVLKNLVARAERAVAAGASHVMVDRSPTATSVSPAQPWWPLLGPLNAQLSRYGDLLRQGRRVASLLVLAPSESIAASACTPLPPNLAAVPSRPRRVEDRAGEVERQFSNLLDALQAHSIDFDLAEEETLHLRGRADLNAFRIGEGGEYTTLVVPPAVSWRAETVRKIRRFARRGGAVILARPIAARVDFETSTALEDLADEFQNVFVVERAGREVCFQYSRLEPRRIQIRPLGDRTADSLAILQRRSATHEMFFVCNTSADRDVEARVSIHAQGAIRILDAWTPRILLRDADDERGARTFGFTFRAGTSVLFAVGGEAEPTEPAHQRLPHATSRFALEDRWEYERTGPNLAPLESGRAALDDKRVGPVQPVDELRAALSRRLHADIGPHQVTLSFPFESQTLFTETNRRLDALVEPVDGMEIRVNGEIATNERDEPLVDPRLRRFEIAPLARRGKNVLEVRYPWSSGPAVVEAPILAGDFAVTMVEGRIVLSEEPEALRAGRLADQGYPFYAGRLRLRQTFDLEPRERERYFVNLHEIGSAGVSVRIGEHEPQMSIAPPFRTEITRLLRETRHTIEIELVSSLDFARPPSETGRERLQPFGLLSGCEIETFDPEAPPPPAEPTQEDQAQSEEGTDTESSESEETTEPSTESF
ncbi:hypothetical protein JW916_11060 [Candidatus Sumerlaeota bacterium]|nr:hypothetical protein [Candidatus Sumerlaeota bacterium]